MASKCFNLKGLVRYRATWSAERIGKSLDPWYLELRCVRGGTISPWGAETLAYSCKGRRPTLRNLIAIGCKLVQDGDQEWTVTFPVALFDKAAQLTSPRLRRRLSQEQKRIQTQRLAPYRLRSRSPASTLDPRIDSDGFDGLPALNRLAPILEPLEAERPRTPNRLARFPGLLP